MAHACTWLTYVQASARGRELTDMEAQLEGQKLKKHEAREQGRECTMLGRKYQIRRRKLKELNDQVRC